MRERIFSDLEKKMFSELENDLNKHLRILRPSEWERIG